MADQAEIDAAVENYIRLQAHQQGDGCPYRCDEMVITHPRATDEFYGCETGCEHWEMTATLACPHAPAEEFEYGAFGNLSDIIEEIDGWYVDDREDD